MADETLFDLPNFPQEVGVVLTPASLRKIDFSGLDFTTARRAIIDYLITYYPDRFNDFVASNGYVMMIEIVAAAVAKLSLRADILAGEATLPTCKTEEATVNHLALINQRIRRQTSAVVDVECSVDNPVFTDVRIPAKTAFRVRSADGGSIYYELFRAPGDFESDVVIPAGKRGVIAYGLEGKFTTPFTVVSQGGPNQQYTINAPEALDWPVYVTISSGSVTEQWQAVVDKPLERFGPTDKVVEITFIGPNLLLRFGDDVTGAAPLSGQTISVSYRTGGGSRGRIGAGQLSATVQVVADPPANAPVQVSFRNAGPSAGGVDRETIEQAKRRAPKDYSIRTGIVTADDYAQAAKNYAHPAFGSVVKAVATVRTGRNANLVEVYCLADGPDGIPVAPNAGLKLGLETYYSDLNVATDTVKVLGGGLRRVDVSMTVVVSRSADAAVVKSRVESAVTDFFAVEQWEMGKPLYVSNFIDVIGSIDGVHYVDVFSPSSNVLSGVDGGVAFNELIVEGSRQIKYYYERTVR